MRIVGELLMLLGGLVAVLAAVGLVRFRTPYARLHSAGKASPVAFLITAIGASLLLDFGATVLLGVAALAMVLTLPLGVHLLFRALHGSGEHRPDIDALGDAQQQ